jgi:hypothetical protein
MMIDLWLALAPESKFSATSSKALLLGDKWFVCVGRGATASEALANAKPYGAVELYDSRRGELQPKARE